MARRKKVRYQLWVDRSIDDPRRLTHGTSYYYGTYDDELCVMERELYLRDEGYSCTICVVKEGKHENDRVQS